MCLRDEGIALGELYQHMASYAYEIGVKIGYVSTTGTSSNIETGIIRDYLTGKTNPDGSDMFHFILGDGNHNSFSSYLCTQGAKNEKFRQETFQNSG